MVFKLCSSLASVLLILSSYSAPVAANEVSSTPSGTTRQDAPGQHTSDGQAVELDKRYLEGYVSDLRTIVTAPRRWDATDWITMGIAAGVAAGLYDNDAKIQKWVLDHKTSTTSDLGDTLTDFGHGKFTPVIVGGMYLYGRFADDGKMRRTALLSVESFVITGVLVQTVKFATHRHRPYTGDPPHTWDGPGLDTSSSTMSFPSGHASSAFAVATVIASEYDNAVVPPIAYSIAAVTALNRVMHNAHWSSDIFVGSLVGYFTGKAVVASHRAGSENRVSVAPMIDDNGNTGLIMTYRF